MESYTCDWCDGADPFCDCRKVVNKGEELEDWIERIRNSKTFGRGSCSTVDECMSDSELREELARFSSFTEAWDSLVELEEIHWDMVGIPWKPVKEVVL